MLKDLLGFLNGTIIKENSTSSKIILSNGHKYDAKLFHQSLGIVRMLVNKEVNSLEQQEFLAHVKEEQEKAQNLRVSNLIKFTEQTDLDILMSQPILIKFGKYKGQKTNAVKDIPYFNWMLSKVAPIEKFI